VADIENLETNPRPRGAELLTSRSGRWRIRSGDYRVIYEIADAELVVLVVSVGHRREVYRDL
jgi:mRNA interferase RelE/StbE